ncbi:hypothetical protein H6P81_017735 [Aristolochia fimbriata]|uniref:Secreted protein n=1 Tax=Aristolochia fimbriata TaxID=158543 RepID=A0AAV7E1W9_ARIFI|nr:hypothetical protein H6P81_017735 [Aristolochia fimbriata]
MKATVSLVFCFLFFFLLLLSLPDTLSRTAAEGRSLHAATIKKPPPPRSSTQQYVVVRPRSKKRRHALIGSCMPKGFRAPPSAPSRFVNTHILGGSSLCDTPKRHSNRKLAP